MVSMNSQNAKSFNKLSAPEQQIVSATRPGREYPHGYKFLVVTNADDYYVNYFFYNQDHTDWEQFTNYTVEDHGDHWRVRGDGRLDRWYTVRK